MKFFYVLFSIFIFSCGSSNTEKQKEENKDPIVVVSNQIEKDITNDALYVERAKINIDRDRLVEALKDLEQAILLDSTNGHSHYLYADVLFEMAKRGEGTSQSAILSAKHFQIAISYQSDLAMSYKKGAEILLAFKKFEDALQLLQMSISIEENNHHSYILLGYCYNELGDIEHAMSNFQKSISIESNNEEAYMQIGNLYYSLNDSNAIQYYNSVISLNPTNRIAYYNIALCYDENQYYNKAQDAYHKILDFNIEDVHYINSCFNLGVMFQEALDDPKNAIDYYLEAIRINEKHFLSFYQMAICYQKLGDVRSAEKYYKQSLVIAPEFKKAQNQLDQLLLDNKKYK